LLLRHWVDQKLAIQKTAKIDWIINYLNKKFFHYYESGEYVVIDEGMIPYRGKFCAFRQHIKRKPINTGIKYWAMASNKYLLSFQLYVGKSEEVRQHKLGIEVVLNFISVLPNLPHYSDWRFVFWIFRVSWEVKKKWKKNQSLQQLAQNWLFAKGIHFKGFSKTKLKEMVTSSLFFLFANKLKKQNKGMELVS